MSKTWPSLPLSIILLVVILSGCGGKEDPPPPDQSAARVATQFLDIYLSPEWRDASRYWVEGNWDDTIMQDRMGLTEYEWRFSVPQVQSDRVSIEGVARYDDRIRRVRLDFYFVQQGERWVILRMDAYRISDLPVGSPTNEPTATT